ncbi:hypothetical protein [Arenibacter amylolyticus]|uniref:hypothetical protein n=1 Tax=Arenibacter amylolyticus TaxID=1406873 RepID=UPI000A374E58|nr:hypothetical protein [Arenibacter amylolyticus]
MINLFHGSPFISATNKSYKFLQANYLWAGALVRNGQAHEESEGYTDYKSAQGSEHSYFN